MVNPHRKELKGPKVRNIDFDRLLNARDNNDEEILGQTTLMIRNVPIRFDQVGMLALINKKFANKFNYFYLPKDLRTQ